MKYNLKEAKKKILDDVENFFADVENEYTMTEYNLKQQDKIKLSTWDTYLFEYFSQIRDAEEDYE